MAAGSIVVDLLMRTGSFETDTARAAKSMQRLQKEAKATQQAFKASFAGNLLSDITQQVGSYLGQLPGKVLADVDAFNDLKDATGASIENISALDKIARDTGTTFDTVSTSLIKLNQAITKAKPDSDAERAIQALGLSVEDLKKLDPAEAFQKVAVAVNGFADNGNKARVVQELFGKSLKEVAPLLKDVAEKGTLVATTTTAQAEAVEAYRKQTFKLKADIEDLGRSFLISLIPYIQESTQKIRELFGASAGQDTLNKRIVSLQVEVENAQSRFDKGDSLLDIALYGRREYRQKNLDEAKARLAKARADYQALVGTSTAGAGRGGSFRPDVGDPAKPPKPPAAADPFASSIKSATEMEAAARAALASEDELTDAEKLRAKVLADLSAGILTATEAQKKQFLAVTATASEEQKQLELRGRAKAADQEAAQARESFYQQQQKVLDGFNDEAAAARESANTFGFTQEELAKLNTEKLRAAAASLELLAITKGEQTGNESLARLYRKQAAALRARAGAEDELTRKQTQLQNDPLTGANQAVKDYLDNISKAGHATYDVVTGALQSLEDITVQALQGGNIKSAAKSLVNQIIAEFYRLQVVRPLLNSIFSSGGGLEGILRLFSGGSYAGGNTTQSGPIGGVDFSGVGFPLAGGTNYVPYDGFQATLHKGEAVVPKAYNQAATGGDVSVQVINNTGAPVREERSDQGGKKMVRIIVGEVARDMGRGGPTRQAARSAVGPGPRRG